MDNLEPITRNEMFLNGDDLEPITREEMILAGADLEPITRHEWFLKKYRGGGGGGEYDLVNIPNLPADIASFNDGTDLPMASLKVAVTPYQDLHGYDGPWAGGAGKNKLDSSLASTTTKSGITMTVTKNAVGQVTKIHFQGTASDAVTFVIGSATLSAGQYILNAVETGGSLSSIYINYSGIANASSSVATATLSETKTTNCTAQISSGAVVNTDFYPMICFATETDATFAPYSNICPIIGWDEVNVTRRGKNLCKSTVHGYVSSSDDLIVIDNDTESAIFYAHEGQTYTISSSATMDKSRVALVGTDNIVNYTPILQREILSDNVNTWTATWTGWTVWYKCSSRQTAFDNSTQVELGSTATAYEPYNGHTYTIDLDGTRYGGEVDATNGTMDDTLDHIASYNGETLPSTWISDRDVYAEGTTPTVGAEVVYTRATPITVQLAPTPAKSIEGENNISADCGQITEVKYFKKA